GEARTRDEREDGLRVEVHRGRGKREEGMRGSEKSTSSHPAQQVQRASSNNSSRNRAYARSRSTRSSIPRARGGNGDSDGSYFTSPTAGCPPRGTFTPGFRIPFGSNAAFTS